MRTRSGAHDARRVAGPPSQDLVTRRQSTAPLPPDLAALLDYLKRSRGFDFSGYKPASLTRRFHKRMQAVGVDSYTAYVDYLEVHPDEFALLFDTVLINVTTFFRDGAAWEALAKEVEGRHGTHASQDTVPERKPK